jgi:hypothetical protein
MDQSTKATQSKVGPRPQWRAFLISSGVGILVLLASFPRVASRMVHRTLGDSAWRDLFLYPIRFVQGSLHSLTGTNPHIFFQRILAVDFLVLWFLLFVLLLFSLRHKNGRLLSFGAGGFLAGYIALHLFSWVMLVILKVMTTTFNVLVWISSLVGTIATFVFVQGWWLIALGILAFLFFAFRDSIIEVLLYLLSVAVLAILTYHFVPPLWHQLTMLIFKIFEPFIKFWMNHALLAFSVLLTVFLWVVFILLVVLAVFGVIATLGRLLIDQIRAAWSAGKGEKHLALGTFAIGSALALIILTSVATPPVSEGVDTGWQQSLQTVDGITSTRIASGILGGLEPTSIFVATMPQPVEKFAFTYLTAVPPPIVEAIVLLLITLLTIVSLLRHMAPTVERKPAKFTKYFIPVEYLKIAFFLIAPVLILFARGYMEE